MDAYLAKAIYRMFVIMMRYIGKRDFLNPKM